MKKGLFILMTILTGYTNAFAQASTDIYLTDNKETTEKIGSINFNDSEKGLRVDVDLHNLPGGEHGFHIHENPDCSASPDKDGNMQPALAAGGHYDPDKTGKHLGPHKHGGHRGDLPALNVTEDGIVKTTFYISDLTVAEIKNRSLIIHAGGDNYEDTPMPLGGGGARIACGIIK
ncbi:MAG: superoxide dismutase family protein [Alphaproteobacteria bacterium]|nr:superoxide dismutase family protein [Alphaproteobacteria bacterium]